MRDRASQIWFTILGCGLLFAACNHGKPALPKDGSPAQHREISQPAADHTARERGPTEVGTGGDASPPINCAAPFDLWGVDCFQYCNQESDCVRAKVGCCSCHGGGKQVPIHKGWAAVFAKRFATCSFPPPGCPAEDLCDICTAGNTTAPLACQGGKCTIICP